MLPGGMLAYHQWFRHALPGASSVWSNIVIKVSRGQVPKFDLFETKVVLGG